MFMSQPPETVQIRFVTKVSELLSAAGDIPSVSLLPKMAEHLPKLDWTAILAACKNKAAK
jgi:hypothetical protein